jgi:hypothetical protein
MEIQLSCTKGNAKIKPRLMGKYENPQLLTGKRRRWDSLHWSLMNRTDKGHEVSLQGLYRGSYADAVVLAKDLHRALLDAGMPDSAARLANALASNDEIV